MTHKKFIVFEGVDGSGKDTQLEKTVSYLRKKDKHTQIWITKEPTDNTQAGREILEKLSGKGFETPREALKLFVQDRIEQTIVRNQILPHSTILSSRFDYSTYVYQGLQGLTFDEIYRAHDYEKNQIRIPDITFIFDVSKENIQKRMVQRGGKKEFFENIDFLEQANQKYLEIAEKFKSQRNIYVIDANATIETVGAQVEKILDLYF